MQINKDFTIQKVGSSYLAVAVGETSKHFRGMIKLNEVGAFIWKALSENDLDRDALVDALLAEYEVERSVAEADVDAMLETLKQNGCLA